MRFKKKILEETIGKVIAVHFDDHSEDGNELVDTWAYGKLIEVKRKHLVIICWEVDNDSDEDGNKLFSIAKGTIKDLIICLPKRQG